MLKTLFRGRKQYHIICKRQIFHLAASNGDTLVNLAVTVYPIHIEM